MAGFTRRSRDLIAAWSTELMRRPPFWAMDTIDANRADLLQRTLPTWAAPPAASPAARVHEAAHEAGSPLATAEAPRCSPGDPFLPAGHMVLFPPRLRESELAADGYVSRMAPPAPFLGRMWAGGGFDFRSAKAPLRIGEDAVQATVPADVRLAMISGGQQEAVFLSLHKYMAHRAPARQSGPPPAWQVRETRDYVYRAIADEAAPPAERDAGEAPQRRSARATSRAVALSHSVVMSPVLLFRFSALTWNSHRIHYEHAYAKGVEGYPAPLVHGPLTATLLANLGGHGVHLRRFTYRALAPLFVNETVTFKAAPAKPVPADRIADCLALPDSRGQGASDPIDQTAGLELDPERVLMQQVVWAENDSGVTGMKGTLFYEVAL